MTDNLLSPGPDQQPDNQNFFEQLVGDGKKFKDAEELAKGKFYADQTVDVLTKRMDELREDYLKVRDENVTRARLEDLMDQLSKRQQASSDVPTAKDDKPSYDPSQLDSLVANKIKEHEVSKKQQENFDLVKTKLKEQFGDNFVSVLKQRSTELELSEDDINSLAKKSPSALFRTLGFDQPKDNSFQAPPRSSQRNDTFAPKGATKRTWSYYQELKKTNPKLYFDTKIATQMMKDAVEQGESFRDGDYYIKGLHDN